MFDSIRLRLTFWYVGVLALVIVAFAALTYLLVGRILARQTDENLSEMARNFQTTLEAELSGDSSKQEIETGIKEELAELRFHDFLFIVADGSRQVASTATDDKSNAALLASDSRKTFQTIKIGGGKFRLQRGVISCGGENYLLLIARSLEEQEEFLSRLRSIFLLAVPLSLIITGLGGYFLARKSLAPVAEMNRRAADIGATNLHERLPVKNEKDELGGLAHTFNRLLARLENSFEQQHRFMADASHELRTPLAIVRGESEVALSKETRPTAELRESLAIVHDESKRLTKIVEELFTLARADAGQLAINDGAIYLDELLADSVRAVHVLAENRKINFEFQVSGEMPMRGDEQLLRRLFINLLDNAIKYNRENGSISISAESGKDFYRVLISDTGRGISDEEKTKVFERFYRADQARSRRQETLTSGAGLGLSIALWIAELHRGKIEIVSSNEHGSRFAVVLPVSK